MRARRVFVSFTFLVMAASAAFAQTPTDTLTPLQVAVACGPAIASAPPARETPRILGSQDTLPRSIFGAGDLLVVGTGTNGGLQLGQMFFVRRPITFGAVPSGRGRDVATGGWIRIVAVNETTAIATVDHACGAISTGDYLDPFLLPALPANAEQVDTTGEPDFSMPARVLTAKEDRRTAGQGDLVVIDRGANHGLLPGTRLAIYRDVSGLPLAALGDATVMTTTPTTALVLINRSRDAVEAGDYVVPRR